MLLLGEQPLGPRSEYSPMVLICYLTFPQDVL